MPNRRLAVAGGLLLSIAASRWLCRSRALYDLDSVNFALALGRFDPAVHQPHPPGYYLYVQLGRLSDALVQDANLALVLVSIAASCAAGAAIYRLAESWYGEGAAGFALLLFAISPLAWFHGTVALTYAVEAAFSALVGYGCWRVAAGEERWAVPAAAMLALGAGFRPSLALFLGPLWLFSLRRVRWRTRLLCGAAGLAVALAWMLPMLHASGGAGAYGSALARLAGGVPARRTTLAEPALAVARLAAVGWGLVLCCGLATPLLFRRRGVAPQRTFVWVWIGPGAAFFTLVFLNYVNLGYLLVLCPPVFAEAGGAAWEFLRGKRRRAVLAAAAVAAHGAFYLFAPVYCSYRGVREFERSLAAAVAAVRGRYSAQDTAIVSFDSHFLGYRHAGYYAPEFLTVQYPEQTYAAGPRTFCMRGRDTRLAATLPLAGMTRFVIFPLPEGAEYQRYRARALARLPRGTLQERRAGGATLYEGPAAALASLFPATFPR